MIPFLCKQGSKVFYYDPTGPKKNFQKVKNCQYKNKIKDACKNVDLIVLHTEWDEFKSFDWKEFFDKSKSNSFIFDARNIIDKSVTQKMYSIGN